MSTQLKTPLTSELKKLLIDSDIKELTEKFEKDKKEIEKKYDNFEIDVLSLRSVLQEKTKQRQPVKKTTWTDEETELIKKLHLEGKKGKFIYTELYKQFKKYSSIQQVNNKIKSLGLTTIKK